MKRRGIITALAAVFLLAGFGVAPASAATAAITTDQSMFTGATGATPIDWPANVIASSTTAVIAMLVIITLRRPMRSER